MLKYKYNLELVEPCEVSDEQRENEEAFKVLAGERNQVTCELGVYCANGEMPPCILTMGYNRWHSLGSHLVRYQFWMNDWAEWALASVLSIDIKMLDGPLRGARIKLTPVGKTAWGGRFEFDVGVIND